MNFIEKLRKKPERQRKIILWVVMVVITLSFATWWVYRSYKNLKELRGQEIINNMNLPSFDDLPEVEIPEALKEGIEEQDGE